MSTAAGKEHRPYRLWSQSDFEQYSMWKETLTPAERRQRYACLRGLGASRAEAQRFRDWHPGRYEMILDRFAEDPKSIGVKMSNRAPKRVGVV